MKEEIIKQKIQALLHDPPEKALILRRVGHEDRAKGLIARILEEGASISDIARKADHIASAADRINFPKDVEERIDFQKTPVVTHPLSGRYFDLRKHLDSPLASVDYKEVMENVDKALDAFCEKYTDLERRYLAIWRNLKKGLQRLKEGNSALGQLWDLLPADTRVPDHSIWDHQRIASAIAGALPDMDFVLFSIGPVQDFIATARKTQDLWSGSYILSYLSWSAMKVICEEVGPDSILFPDLLGQPFCDAWLNEKGIEVENLRGIDLPTLPNRFLALLPGEDSERLVKRSEKVVEATFMEMGTIVKETIEGKLPFLKGDHVWEGIWKRQIQNFIEKYWVILPIGGKGYREFRDLYIKYNGEEHLEEFKALLKAYEEKGFTPNLGTIYGLIYDFLERLHGSRKVLRDFSQAAEPHYKCTMCGVREPLHPGRFDGRDCSDFRGLVDFWQKGMKRVFPDTKASECLCAICTTKRFARVYFVERMGFKIEGYYPSTSSVATAPFKLRLLEKGEVALITKLHRYVKAVKNLAGEDGAFGGTPPMVWRFAREKGEMEMDIAKIEGNWLYEDTIDKNILRKEYGYRFEEEEFTKFFDALKTTFKEYKEALREARKSGIDLPGPSRYYAIIHMDGDHMGKWLSGEKAPLIGDILHEEMRVRLKEDPEWKRLVELRRPLNPSLHVSISKALRDFSLKMAREIVEKDHCGKLIYAGGDDVLAFVPLSDLLSVMKALRAYFSGALKQDDEGEKWVIDFKDGSGFVPIDDKRKPLSLRTTKKPQGFLYTMGTTATASMGVAIVHHSYDLRKALDEAREAEEMAKNKYGRNAFCISLNKRAGGTVEFGTKWYFEDDDYFESIPLIEMLVDAFGKDELSPRFAYDLQREATGVDAESIPIEVKEKEMKRLFLRHMKRKESEGTRKKAEDLASGLARLIKNGVRMQDISRLLIITTFLARRENL